MGDPGPLLGAEARRQERQDAPSPKHRGVRLRLRGRTVQSCRERKPGDTRTKIAFCPQGHLPSRTGRVWALCAALHPHTQVTSCSTCTPVTRRGFCRFDSGTNSTAPLTCFVHSKEFAGKKLRGSLPDHRPPTPTPPAKSHPVEQA